MKLDRLREVLQILRVPRARRIAEDKRRLEVALARAGMTRREARGVMATYFGGGEDK